MLIVFGAGGFTLQLIDTLEAVEDDIVIVSDGGGEPVCGHPHISADDMPDAPLLLAIGSPKVRRTLADRFAARNLVGIRALTALVSSHAAVDETAVLCDHTVIEANARIGRHFHANVGSFVAHECVIGDFVTFSPSATCCGNVHIGDGVFVGAGAIIRNGPPERPLVVGEGAVIGMGAVVVEDVPPGVTVCGNPAAQH